MSSLIVEVCEIDEINEHPNADALEVAVVKGWECIVRKSSFQVGDRVVYFPLDTLIPLDLAEKLGVTNYLKGLRKDYPQPADRPWGGRVGATRLRGQVSYGLLMELEREDWDVGQNVAEELGVGKWEPPVQHGSDESLPAHPLFHTYTDIENWKNFPHAFEEGEEIALTEKIHGTNARIGLIRTEDGEREWMAGSHNQRRKPPEEGELPGVYWLPMTGEVKSLLSDPAFEGKSVILFGEIFGAGVQDLKYGQSNNQKQFRAFDLAVDFQYLDLDEFLTMCQKHDVATVPLVYRGPYSAEVIREHTSGQTTVCDADQIREGVVIRPVKERRSEVVNGRLVLKSISDDYVLRKGGTEHH